MKKKRAGAFHRPVGRRFLGAILAALWLLTTAQSVAAGPASDVVGKLNAAFLQVMKDGPALGYEGRYEHLEPVVSEAFDFAIMARVAAGSHWRNLTEAQRATLADSFRRYSLAVYAARFKEYSGQKFEILGEQPKDKGAVLVQNQIVRSDGDPVRIDYLLHPEESGQLRIVDVFLKSSISELAVRRSEFTGVIGSQGFDALIATLEKRIKEFAAGKGAEVE
jgi:phospholipid transport system substrate-binding protein